MNYFRFISFILILLAFILFLPINPNANPPQKSAKIKTAKNYNQKANLIEGAGVSPPLKNETSENLTANNISNLNLEAKAIELFDLKNNIEVFTKNSETPFPLASLTKIMTVIIAEENLNENDFITISDEVLKQEGEFGFYVGEKFIAKDLMKIALVSSSNDAAEALSEAVDEKLKNAGIEKNAVELMNEKAKELKMGDTHFLNSTGLDINKKASAYGTARDMQILLNYALKNYSDILESTQEKSVIIFSETGTPHKFLNTNLALNLIKQLIAGKTGFTDAAQGNLVIVFDAGFNHPFSLIILGSSYGGRFKDAEKIVNSLYKF